jgi:hypothetical protein
MRKKPYLKKYGTASHFDVYIVDGSYVREHIDEEFTNFGQHYRFRFIPAREFWIDDERTPGEEEYFVDHMLVENNLMRLGKPYDEALALADRKELAERKRVEFLKLGLGRKPTPAAILRKIRVRLLKKYSSEAVRVWIVNGELVRDAFFIDFTEGGHDHVYPFVPAGEVWLDDDLRMTELRFVLLHEVHERRLMAAKAWPYPRAHRSASHIEYHCRHHPEDLERYLQDEIAANQAIKN